MGLLLRRERLYLGEAPGSWGREALGKHFVDHLQPESEPAPAEDN